MRDLNKDLENFINVLKQSGFNTEYDTLKLTLVPEPRDYQLPTHDEDC